MLSNLNIFYVEKTTLELKMLTIVYYADTKRLQLKPMFGNDCGIQSLLDIFQIISLDLE